MAARRHENFSSSVDICFHLFAVLTHEIFFQCSLQEKFHIFMGHVMFYLLYIDTDEIPNHFTFLLRKVATYYVTIAAVLFSGVKITCYFSCVKILCFSHESSPGISLVFI